MNMQIEIQLSPVEAEEDSLSTVGYINDRSINIKRELLRLDGFKAEAKNTAGERGATETLLFIREMSAQIIEHKDLLIAVFTSITSVTALIKTFFAKSSPIEIKIEIDGKKFAVRGDKVTPEQLADEFRQQHGDQPLSNDPKILIATRISKPKT